MKTNEMILIRDAHNRIGWLGRKTDRPSDEWLAGQSIPFDDDADFYVAYPMNGGSVIVDRNNIVVLGRFSTTAPIGEPRHSALVATWYALRDIDMEIENTDFMRKYYGDDMLVRKIDGETA